MFHVATMLPYTEQDPQQVGGAAWKGRGVRRAVTGVGGRGGVIGPGQSEVLRGGWAGLAGGAGRIGCGE